MRGTCALLQDELDSVDTSVVISSCSLAEARHLLDHFLKASIDKVSWPTDPIKERDELEEKFSEEKKTKKKKLTNTSPGKKIF